MSQQLINHNDDLKRLRDDGYEVEIRSGHLLIHSVPYVNSNCEVARGTLASVLYISGNQTIKPESHVSYFTGDYPCYQDGSKISSLGGGPEIRDFGQDLKSKFSFSNKPPGGYLDHFAKMTRYIEIISAPAHSKDGTAKAQTFKPIPTKEDESVFRYFDTASSRAGIMDVAKKLEGMRIGIVGLGGTGSYVLDLVSKTPVGEIHLFDGDTFLQHNAFRSPGAASFETFNVEESKHLKKVNYFASIYSNMHSKIFSHPEHLDVENIEPLLTLDFIFICIDDSVAKRIIVENLERTEKPFVDVGMGVHYNAEKSGLWGVLRVTLSTPTKRDHVRTKNRISFDAPTVEDEYNQNIQIAELNALNAAMAVIKWKKFSGFYIDEVREHYTTYSTIDNDLANDDLSE